MKATMRIITVPETGIRIGVTNAEEMYSVFFRLHGWWDLEVNGKLYPASTKDGYTRSYFEQFFKADS
jgi:hypothetical protein